MSARLPVDLMINVTIFPLDIEWGSQNMNKLDVDKMTIWTKYTKYKKYIYDACTNVRTSDITIVPTTTPEKGGKKRPVGPPNNPTAK